MKLKVGEVYVRADGQITAPLVILKKDDTEDDDPFPFWDPKFAASYRPNGQYLASNRSAEEDLVKVYRVINDSNSIFDQIIWG